MTTYDFGDGNGPVPAHQHANGGGWIADTVVYDDTVFIGPDALVYGNAWVGHEAQVFDLAVIEGNARIDGESRVYESAIVRGNAQLYGCSFVHGTAVVEGNEILDDEERY